MSMGYDAAYVTSKTPSEIAQELNDLSNRRIALSNELLRLKTRDPARTLNDADLEGYARRVADYARSALEAKDKTWAYLPSFRDEVAAEVLAMLKTVVLHEHMQSGLANESH
jgi:hypothetical protein